MSKSAQSSIRPETNPDKVLMTGTGVEREIGEDDASEDVFANESQEDHVEVDPVVENEGDEDDVDREIEEGEHTAEAMRILPDPGDPTPSQIEDHRANGHIP